MRNRINNIQAGFSLIELAVVLVIVAVLIGSFVGTLTSRIENRRVSETQGELEKIKQHLMGHAYKYGHLPCPDDDGDGEADYNPSKCTTDDDVGTLPWVTLGVGHSDVWGTRYRYWVDKEYANRATLFELGSADGEGSIKKPNYIIDETGKELEHIAIRVVAVIYSHGKNTYGGVSVDNVDRPAIPAENIHELDNSDNNKVFVSRPRTAADASTKGGEFDDIILWMSEFELKANMVKAGQLP